MTLLVSPYYRDSVGEIQWLTVPPEYNDSAGVESTRLSFWGSAAVKKLGLTLVTTLAHSDIYAEGADLSRLAQEIEILTGYVSFLSRKEKTYWIYRLSNVLAAIRIAESCEGGVYIG
ncbi:MAG: hypothetical protein ACFB0D_00785 [Phormidesmis sp.]